MTRYMFCGLLATTLLLSPAIADDDPIDSSVTVAVDLSGTWQRPASTDQNRRLLINIDTAIALAAASLPQPVALRFQKIGTGSLASEPLCEDYRYQSKWFHRHTDAAEGVITSSAGMKRTLALCTEAILLHKGELTTDIGGAIAAASLDAPPLASRRSVLIVLSDMQEETKRPVVFSKGQLANLGILIMYRILGHDADNLPTLLQRINTWAQRLRDAGAEVKTLHDRNQDPATISQMIASLATPTNVHH